MRSASLTFGVLIRRALGVSAMALTLLSVGWTAPARAAVRDCPTSRAGIYDVSARNMSCRGALRRIARARYVGPSSLSARVPGWRCMTVSTYEEGATFRCVRGRRAFRWTAGG